MNICKICSKDLYQKISFENIFKINYTVHAKCMKSIVINNDRITFPINDNLVYYDYLFYEMNKTYNFNYLETEYMYKLFTRSLKNKDWSIIIYYEDGLFADFTDNELLILFSLSNLPFLIISLVFSDLSNIFNENF